jgi:hypothetical protein
MEFESADVNVTGQCDGNSTCASSKAIIIISIFEFLKEHPWGYVGFLFFLTVWTVLALPVTPIEVCAGYVFGPIWGTLGSLFGKTLGCLGALSIGRLLGKSRGWRVPAILDQYLHALRTKPLRVSIVPLTALQNLYYYKT